MNAISSFLCLLKIENNFDMQLNMSTFQIL